MVPTAILAITFADGTVGRMQFFGQDTSDARLQAEIDKGSFEAVPVSWRRVRLADFPVTDHDFRAAWKDTGGRIRVDMVRAKVLTRDRVGDVTVQPAIDAALTPEELRAIRPS